MTALSLYSNNKIRSNIGYRSLLAACKQYNVIWSCGEPLNLWMFFGILLARSSEILNGVIFTLLEVLKISVLNINWRIVIAMMRTRCEIKVGNMAS